MSIEVGVNSGHVITANLGKITAKHFSVASVHINGWSEEEGWTSP
jgi:hypothetical protein